MASNPLDWKVTISFRPIRAFARLVLLTSILAVCWLPLSKVERVQGAWAPPPVVPVVVVMRPVEEVKHETAVNVVKSILDEKMSKLPSAKREALAKAVVDESMVCNLDPLFSLAVADVESRKNGSWDHEAVSAVLDKTGRPIANAKGFFQVIDSTWDTEVRRRGLTEMEKFNPIDNARVGIGYLCHLAETFKRPDSLLLAYNQGPGTATLILKGESTGDDQAPRYAPAVWAAYKGLLAEQGLPHDPKSMRASYRKPEATIYVSQLHPPYDPTNTALIAPPDSRPKKAAKTALVQVIITAPSTVVADISADVPPPPKVFEGTDFRCKPGLEKFRYHEQVRCLSPDTAKNLNLEPFVVASAD